MCVCVCVKYLKMNINNNYYQNDVNKEIEYFRKRNTYILGLTNR